MATRGIISLAVLAAGLTLLFAAGAASADSGLDLRYYDRGFSLRLGTGGFQSDRAYGYFDGPSVPLAWRHLYFDDGRYGYGYGYYGPPEPVRPWYPRRYRAPVQYHWYAEEARRGERDHGHAFEGLARPSTRRGFGWP